MADKITTEKDLPQEDSPEKMASPSTEKKPSTKKEKTLKAAPAEKKSPEKSGEKVGAKKQTEKAGTKVASRSSSTPKGTPSKSGSMRGMSLEAMSPTEALQEPAEQMSSLEGLAAIKTKVDAVKTKADKKQQNDAPRKLDSKGRMYATGRRKDAVARVWIRPGSGEFTVNARSIETYFARPTLRMIINQPLNVANRSGQYDVECTIVGGGLSGQAGAMRHGLSRALALFEPALRAVLKTNGFLTRDSRVVERKKFGRAKARRRFQFSKR